MRVKLYVEGGGDSKALRSRCREGFRKLLEKAGFRGRMPAVVACGGRQAAYDDFTIALRNATSDLGPMLLVDSEAPVERPAWEHLEARDGWARPDGSENDHAQLMVQCMETWLVADRQALRQHFGQAFRGTALPDSPDLEAVPRDDVQSALQNATRDCGRHRKYEKGRRSFRLLGEVDPATLRSALPAFGAFCDALDRRL